MTITFVAGAAVAEQNPQFVATPPYTFTGLNGGVNFPAGCVIVLAVGDISGSASVFTSAKVGGYNLINLGQIGEERLNVYYGSSSSALTDTVVFSGPNACQYLGVVSGYLTGSSAAPSSHAELNPELSSDFPISTNTGTCTVAAGGIGLALVYSLNDGTYASPTFTGTTSSGGDVNTTNINGTSQQLHLAQSTTTGTFSPTYSNPSTDGKFGSAIVTMSFNVATQFFGNSYFVMPP